MRQHNLPTEITIGPICYAVKVVARLVETEQSVTFVSPTDNTSDAVLAKAEVEVIGGEIDDATCEIHLCEGMAHQRRVVVLMHEVIHGILSNAGLDDHDEQMVEALAVGLVDVLQRNPELAHTIMDMHTVTYAYHREMIEDRLRRGFNGADPLMNTTRR